MSDGENKNKKFRSYSLRDRAAVAREEIGHTEGPAAAKIVLIGIFLLLVFGVPLVQAIYELRLHQQDRRPRATPQVFDIFGELIKASQILFAASDAPLSHPKAATAGSGFFDRLFAANSYLLGAMQAYQDDLKEDSFLSQSLVPISQSLQTDLMGVGNEKTLVGRDGWLFYHEAFSHLTGDGFLSPRHLVKRRLQGGEWQAPPQPDPVLALLHFRLKLAQRGIHLIIVPIPNKPVIYGDYLGVGADPCRDGPIRNPSTEQLLIELAEPGRFFDERFARYRDLLRNPKHAHLAPFLAQLEAGRELLEASPSLVYDPSERLRSARCDRDVPLFLKTDLHWRPEAVELTAEGLAEFVETQVTLDPPWHEPLATQPVELTGFGDIGRMLELPQSSTRSRQEKIRINQVLWDDGLWRPDRQAQVLLVGDSLTNIFSLQAMGWGEGAGLAEQLSRHLGRPVDSIARNDRGAHQSRQELDTELRRGRDRLAGKKVVIFEFSVRELYHGDWKLFEMELGPKHKNKLWTPVADGPIEVEATLKAISHVPRPDAVPYPDHICAVELVDLKSPDQAFAPGTSVVSYMYSMRAKRWTQIPRLRMGDRIRVRLSKWDEASLGSLNRSDLEALELEEHAWAELVRGVRGAAGLQPRDSFGPSWPEALAISLLAIGLAVILGLIRRRETRTSAPVQKS